MHPVQHLDLMYDSAIRFGTISCSGGFFHRVVFASFGLREDIRRWRVLLRFSEAAVRVWCLLGFISGIRGKELE